MKAKYVIIGNSTAAVGCAEGIRTLDKEGTIIMDDILNSNFAVLKPDSANPYKQLYTTN